MGYTGVLCRSEFIWYSVVFTKDDYPHSPSQEISWLVCVTHTCTLYSPLHNPLELGIQVVWFGGRSTSWSPRRPGFRSFGHSGHDIGNQVSVSGSWELRRRQSGSQVSGPSGFKTTGSRPSLFTRSRSSPSVKRRGDGKTRWVRGPITYHGGCDCHLEVVCQGVECAVRGVPVWVAVAQWSRGP